MFSVRKSSQIASLVNGITFNFPLWFNLARVSNFSPWKHIELEKKRVSETVILREFVGSHAHGVYVKSQWDFLDKGKKIKRKVMWNHIRPGDGYEPLWLFLQPTSSLLVEFFIDFHPHTNYVTFSTFSVIWDNHKTTAWIIYQMHFHFALINIKLNSAKCKAFWWLFGKTTIHDTIAHMNFKFLCHFVDNVLCI